MGDWKAILSAYTKNLNSNPSFELGTVDWAAGGTNTIAQSAAQQFKGRYSMLCTYDNQVFLASLTPTYLVASTTYFMSARIWVPANWDGAGYITCYGLNYTGATIINNHRWAPGADPTEKWFYIESKITFAADVTGTLWIHCGAFPTVGRTIYVDAVQIEQQDDYATSFCDGDQPGCEWLNAPHASVSQRSAVSRAGGVVHDLKDDYGFGVVTEIGTGVHPVIPQVIQHATLPGGQVDDVQIPPRPFTLSGVLKGSGASCDLRAARQDLWSLLNPKAVPKDRYGIQPVRFRYTGAAVDKEIAAIYEGGLEANIGPNQRIHEKMALRLLAKDPFWYEVGESAKDLNSIAVATLRYVTGRLRSTGQWDDLGLTANPDVGGTIYAAAYNPHNGLIYFGGNFEGMNGVAGRDHFAAYDPATDTWSTVGAGSTFDNTVWSIAIAPNGDVYVGSNFSDVGGGNGDYIAYWDISGGAWMVLAGGGTGPVYAMAFGLDGVLYCGGSFLNWGALGANYAFKWTGAAYAVMDAGNELDDQVNVIVTHPDSNVYFGGNFNQFGANVCNYWCRYDGTDFQIVDTSINSIVYSIAITSDGRIFIGGAFTNIGDANGDRIVMWNGQQYQSLGSGAPNGIVYRIDIGPDGMLYAFGTFTEIGGITVADRMAKWNDSSWAYLDVDLPGTPIVRASAIGPPDPAIDRNYDLYLGFNTTGQGRFADKTTVSNDGTANVYPVAVFERSGGTGAIVETVRNETTGKELLFNYSLLDGERLTIDLAPTRKSVVSSMFGAVPNAILKNSDFGQWLLQPDDNEVTCFIQITGAPTITAYLLWKDTYGGND